MTTTTTELAPREIKLLIKSATTRLKKMDGVIEAYEGWHENHPGEADEFLKSNNWGTIEQLRADYQDLADLKMKLKQL